ncbi:MAG TPA: energy transducer TonB [Acidobacteriota bacterium]|nr:energy transducer TonB [Acidobacteriota bacterium]HQF85830.1 energy transducer TonB [Acidobacteriota bacterium]HQG90926.1 energy transducer TonB [Acidobacteriota bacterium]HQK87522.1 energy transducer TonB [Acidobacteriota bacterium]
MDAMNRDPNIPEPESAPTTKLLKKKPERIEAETAVTAPLTSRLADLAIDDEEKKKSNVGLIVGGILAGLAVIAVIVYFAFFSGGSSGIFSGGSADIAAGGTDSMDAQIVQGRSPGQASGDRQSAAVPSISQPGASADRRDEAARDAGRSGAAPVVQAARIESSATISSGTEAAPTIPVRPAPTQPAPAATPTPAPAQPQPQPATTTPAAPPSTPASASPAPATASSMESGFTLSEQPKVKEGDLVPLTDDVIKPEITKRATPAMPALARQLKKSGQVIVRVLVDENGSVADAKLVNETPKGFGFGKAATDAAWDFKYKPARKGNVRVKVWDTIFFTFR